MRVWLKFVLPIGPNGCFNSESNNVYEIFVDPINVHILVFKIGEDYIKTLHQTLKIVFNC